MAETREGQRSTGERFFRFALHALPPAFRRKYGDEILAFHEKRMAEAGASPQARASLHGRAVLDLASGALLEWGKEVRRQVGLSRCQGRAGSVGPKEPGGPPEPIRRYRSQGLAGAIDFLLQDIRFAVRGLARTPAFTVVALLSLALGIGTFAAGFSLVQETWLRPVPGVKGDEVVEILVIRRGAEFDTWAYPDFKDLREAETPFRTLVGWRERNGTLTTAQGGEPVRMMYVSADYFRALGVVPALGRDFSPSEDEGPGAHPVAVVSHDMWRERLGGNQDVLGMVLTLNQDPCTVVGVAPAEFKGHRVLKPGVEVWVPLMQDPWVAGADPLTEDRSWTWLRVLGWLKGSATLDEANAALQTVMGRLAEADPESNEDRSARAYAFGPVPAAGRAESLMGTSLVFAVLGIVLLIICGNVTGMVLARDVTREKELAVRMALGSGGRRLARLLMVEAVILASLGGGLGLLLGVWGVGVLASLVPGAPPMVFRPEAPVLGVVLGLTVATALAVGLSPAIRFSRPGLVSSLREAGGGGGRRAGRIHRIAASAQTGVALVLLVSCGLFLRALGVMAHKDLGFQPEGILTTRMDLSQHGYGSPELATPFLEEVRERLSQLPGVTSVSIADGMPLDLVGNFTRVAPSDGAEEGASGIQVEFTRADEGFFETVGTPLLRGRGFLATDDAASEPVAVISESIATRLWPGQEAVGRRIRTTLSRDPERDFTVVGVVPEVSSSRATESWPNVFLSLRQNHGSRVMVLVRATGDPAATSRAVQRALLRAEPGLPFPTIETSESLVARSTQGQRMSAWLGGGLSILALLLSAIGLYGVVAFSVSSRTREIGLRMAVGATRKTVLRGVLRDTVRLALPGLAVGCLLAVGTAAVLRSELLGLGPLDPVAFLGSAAVLFVVVLLAGLVPARRAAAIHPMQALRKE
jgi:putative ABC transport system permease protein